MELTPEFLAAGAKVVDLSGAFRLRTVENYRRWYKEEHTAGPLLDEAAYGLPEFYRNTTKAGKRRFNPILDAYPCFLLSAQACGVIAGTALTFRSAIPGSTLSK